MNKEKWAESLEVGDLIEDCRFRIMEISEVRKEYSEIPSYGYFILRHFPLWIPWKIFVFVENILMMMPGKRVFIDSTLVLKDGAHCSAKYCCDPITKPTGD